MKVKVPVIIEDQLVQNKKGLKMTQNVTLSDDFFLSGPISSKVAVLDFDENGNLRPAVDFVKNKNLSKPGHFNRLNKREIDIHSDAFMQGNVFGIVSNTIEMFEEPDNLGRPIKWAFDSPQLLVIPRAGEWANAFYQRDSKSLQFFYFQSKNSEGKIIYTSLSHDIVAHETGHAILDGIAPDLYDAITPQSLALHEAVADITAVLMSFRSQELVKTVLEQTGGSIKNSSAFSSIATEFGSNLGDGIRPLRSLLNNQVLSESGAIRTDVHQLSEILSGALYKVMVNLHEQEIEKEMAKAGRSRFSASGRALFIASEKFKRMTLRALDYLPPGEISFADFGRAIVAVDKAAYPYIDFERKLIAEEFLKRKIITKIGDLLNETLSKDRKEELEKELNRLQISDLYQSDWSAYEFANNNRALLGIPENTPFEIKPRIDSTKKYFKQKKKGDNRNDIQVRECILKIAWSHKESNPTYKNFPSNRVIKVGLTLAIDWESKKIRSFLTTDEHESLRADRDNMLIKLYKDGVLELDHDSFDFKNLPRQSMVKAIVNNDVLKVNNTARLLHICNH